jgi:hypothetical protein
MTTKVRNPRRPGWLGLCSLSFTTTEEPRARLTRCLGVCRTVAVFRRATARCRDGQWLVLRETQCKRAGARQTRAMSCTAFSRDRRHLASMNELSSKTTGHRREIATAGGSCAPSHGEGSARKTFECFVQGDVKAPTDLLGTSKQHV